MVESTSMYACFVLVSILYFQINSMFKYRLCLRSTNPSDTTLNIPLRVFLYSRTMKAETLTRSYGSNG